MQKVSKGNNLLCKVPFISVKLETDLAQLLLNVPQLIQNVELWYTNTGNDIFQMAYGFTKQTKFILSHSSILELLSIYDCIFFRASVSLIKKAIEVITPQKGYIITNQPLR